MADIDDIRDYEADAAAAALQRRTAGGHVHTERVPRCRPDPSLPGCPLGRPKEITLEDWRAGESAA